MSLYVILITQGSSPKCLSPQQVVSEPMVVCEKGSEVFMVPIQRGQRKPERPTHKDPREEKRKNPNKGILLMVLNNGVVLGSHGNGRAGFPWMCVQGWHVVPMDGVRETHGWRVDEVKSPLGKGEWVGLVHDLQRGRLTRKGEIVGLHVWVKSHIE